MGTEVEGHRRVVSLDGDDDCGFPERPARMCAEEQDILCDLQQNVRMEGRFEGCQPSPVDLVPEGGFMSGSSFFGSADGEGRARQISPLTFMERGLGERSTTTAGTSSKHNWGQFSSLACFAATSERSRERRVASASSEDPLQQEIEHLTTFHGCEELLRGLSLSEVLAGWGRLFRTSKSSRHIYELSCQVPMIGYFCSHNWCMGRFKKFISLTMYFHLDVAFYTSMTVAVAMAVCSALGYSVTVYDSVSDLDRPIVGRVLCIPLFFMLIVSLRQVKALFGFEGPMVFLDKACIHQEDRSLQAQGIEKIGAFLYFSEKLLVLYGDQYLSRLWTCYEVAAFLSGHTVGDVEIVPVFQAVLFLGIVLCFYCFHIGSVLVRSFSEDYYWLYTTAPSAAIALWAMRHSMRETRAIRSRLAVFDVRACVCQEEKDRWLVYGNIVSLMKASQVVALSSTDDESLDAFNYIVREKLPSAFGTSEKLIFSYTQYLALGCFSYMFAFDVCGDFALGIDPQPIVVNCISFFFWATTFWPLFVVVAQRLCAISLATRGWREFVLVGLLWLALVMGVGFWDKIFRTFDEFLWTLDKVAVAGYGLFCLLTALATRWYLTTPASQPKPMPQCQEQ